MMAQFPSTDFNAILFTLGRLKKMNTFKMFEAMAKFCVFDCPKLQISESC